MSTDLKIRIISNLNRTQQVLLYQQDIQVNVRNFLTAAWEHPQIAPNSQYDVTLPMDIAVSVASDIGSGRLSTKELRAGCNAAFEIFKNSDGLDIQKSDSLPPTMDTIEIFNKCRTTKYAVVAKDSKPLFAFEVRPDFRVNLAIHPKLYVALSDTDIHGAFFDAVALSKTPVIIDYEGRQYVTIRLDENEKTGLASITYDFDKFI